MSTPSPATPRSAVAPEVDRLALAGALAAVYVIWGSTYYAMRVALETMPPLTMAGIRFLVAGGLLYAWLRARDTPAPRPREWGAAAITGALLLAVGNGAVVFAQQWVSSSLAAIVVATMPLWATVFAAAFGQRPTRAELLALVLGAGGVVLLNADGEIVAHGLGPLVILLAPVAWAFGSMWSRRLPLPAGPMTVATQMLAGGAFLLAGGLARGERFDAVPSAPSLAALAYLIVFGSLVAFTAYTWLLRSTRPAVATSYAYVNPLVAVAIGVGVAGETIGATAWAGGALILASVVLVQRAARRADPARDVGVGRVAGVARSRRSVPGSATDQLTLTGSGTRRC
jgi:drug/metabolite transporter (DMT)-like permease